MSQGGLQDFHDLMRYRIMDILLVASPYDAFVLEEAGQIGERMVGEFRNLDLHYGPGLTTVSTGTEALDLVRRQRRFNLVISGLHLSDMTGAELAQKVQDLGLDIPVVLLAFDSRDMKDFTRHRDLSAAERMFLWQGDARILLAIVKCVEDRRNALHDTKRLGVQVILVIEDNVRYYSAFLPTIYGELLTHSRRLISEGANVSDKIMRMRARPKILLCTTFDEAWKAFMAHQDDVLGVISDVEFPKDGMLSLDAGLEFARAVRAKWPDVPVLLQSSKADHAARAKEVGASFLLKGSPLLLNELRRFMTEYFGFGDFVFRLPDGSTVDRAHDLRSLEEKLHTVPAESIAYHSERNHFSSWLKARTEFALADALRPMKLEDFADANEVRDWLIETIHGYRRDRALAVVADFDRATFKGWEGHDFDRIGGGSLGGKARGLAFMRMLLGREDIQGDVEVCVPEAVVLATDVFDRFVEDNGLRDFAIEAKDDAEIERRFLAAPFPRDAREDLSAFLTHVTCPLAVRSSSLLEDSQHQPFTGVYETIMFANRGATVEARLEQLLRTVARVYASTFSRHAKEYIRATSYRLEEEKMAVILQRVVGAEHATRFYPDFSGVARSHNFYPVAPLTAADGIAAVALGLGRSVVLEGNCLRFCPRDPTHLVQFSSVEDVVANSQRTFWALDLAASNAEEARFDLDVAESDGTLAALASTYSPDNDAVYDGISRAGIRIVSFADVLKHGAFPVAELVDRLLAMGTHGMGGPVEIEFAVDLKAKQFAFLQLRPLALSAEMDELVVEGVEPERVLCRSNVVLGNGKIDDIQDIVVVDRQRFDRGASRQTAFDLAQFNADLAGKPYLLVGVGRWGSADPWLGIPVTWDQISGARVIVEAGFEDFKVTPSQGTHFFQNLTSFNIGYFTVNPDLGDGFVDWPWFAAQPAVKELGCVRHVRTERPIVVKMNGKKSEGIILKP